jgi:hypothetical protein
MISSARCPPIKWTHGTVDVRAGADDDRTFGLTIDDGGPGFDPGRAPQDGLSVALQLAIAAGA